MVTAVFGEKDREVWDHIAEVPNPEPRRNPTVMSQLRTADRVDLGPVRQ